MKPYFTCLAILSSLLGFAQEPAAEAVPIETADADILHIQAGLLYSVGNATWTERGSDFGAGLVDSYRSKLEYNDIDALMLMLNGEVKLNETFRIAARVGFGDIDGASGNDSDWVDGPGLSREFKVSESAHDLNGDTGLWEAEVLWRMPVEHEQWTVDGVIGFGQYYDNTTSTDGRQTLIDEQGVNVPFDGLASTYDFTWSSFRLGVKGTYDLDDQWRFNARVGVMPYIDYRGDAFWNLRTDFKGTPPNFIHKADSGLGFEAKASALYQWSQVTAELGFWWFSYDVDGGTSETFFADGTSAFSDLEADASRSGLFAQVGYTF